MRTITMLAVALLLCGSAWAEDCGKISDGETFGGSYGLARGTDKGVARQNCRIANALEEIARKMPETKEEKEPTYAK